MADEAALEDVWVKGKLIVLGVELGTVIDAPALGSYNHQFLHTPGRLYAADRLRHGDTGSLPATMRHCQYND